MVRWPVLHTGFIVDDYAQLAMMHGEYPVLRSPLSLFTFSDGRATENVQLRAAGFFPWWSSPALRVSLMRPLSSALMWFDNFAFGRDAFKYHLHSACWWIAMMWSAHALLRRLLTGWAAILALALIAAHPAHTVLLGWIANRNAIVATTFALLGLLAQLRAQRERFRPGYALAVGAYAIGLLASEYAIPYLAYGVCLALFDADAASTRTRRIAMWLMGFAGYLALRSVLGFGTTDSGMYIDPLREPAAFVGAASQRLPVLVGDLVLAVRSSWWAAGFPWAAQLALAGVIPVAWINDLVPLRGLLVGIGLIAALGCSVPLLRYLRDTPQRGAADLRFLAAGVPLALLPAVASLPESRLMLPALLGWSALLANATVTRWLEWQRAKRSVAALRCTLVASLCLLESIVPLWYGLRENTGLPALAHSVRGAILEPDLDPLLGPGQHALLLGAIDPTTTIYVSLVRKWHGRPAPDSCQLLLSAYSALKLTRTAATAFQLERLQTQLTALDVYASAFNRAALHKGQRFQAGDMEVRVARVVDGRASVVDYELHRSLDDRSIVLLAQTESGLRPLRFPAIGQSTVIGPPALPIRR